jgi:hypothetical protein
MVEYMNCHSTADPMLFNSELYRKRRHRASPLILDAEV